MNKLSLAVCATVIAVMWAGVASAQATTTAAPASTTTSAPATTTAEAAPDENEMICESQAPATGTLLGGQRVCKTRKQWHDQEAQTQVGQDLHREGMSNAIPGH